MMAPLSQMVVHKRCPSEAQSGLPEGLSVDTEAQV
jgi:hypothetical protein